MTRILERHGEWLAALLFVALMCALGPWWDLHEIDADEGINLMKAALVAEGHHLFTEIWSDQPPLLTYLLAALQETVGRSAGAARALVLLFAAALVWGLFRIVRRREGGVAAWTAVAVLGGAALFQRLGVSVMIGLPALALGVLALERLFAADGRRTPMILSGVLMALSLHTKMFTLVLAPVLLAALVPAWRADRRSVGLWIAAFAVVFGGLAGLAGGAFVDQLVRPHLAADMAALFPYDQGSRRLLPLLLTAPQVLVLGGAGLLLARPWRFPWRTLPILWAATAVATLYTHTPLWTHQILLILVPLAWLGGIAGGEIARMVAADRAIWPRAPAAIAGVGLLAALLWWGGLHTLTTAEILRRPAKPLDAAAVAALRAHANGNPWVVTDRPIDAYHAGLLVPPPLAVYSLKRVRAGLLTPAQVVRVIEEYRPELVSYRRIFMGKAVKSYLGAHYYAVPGRAGQALFVLHPLAAQR